VISETAASCEEAQNYNLQDLTHLEFPHLRREPGYWRERLG
jgi:hypothetical protein